MTSEGNSNVKVEYKSREELDKFLSSIEDIRSGISQLEIKINKNAPRAKTKTLQQQLSTLREQLSTLQHKLTPPAIVHKSFSVLTEEEVIKMGYSRGTLKFNEATIHALLAYDEYVKKVGKGCTKSLRQAFHTTNVRHQGASEASHRQIIDRVVQEVLWKISKVSRSQSEDLADSKYVRAVVVPEFPLEKSLHPNSNGITYTTSGNPDYVSFVHNSPNDAEIERDHTLCAEAIAYYTLQVAILEAKSRDTFNGRHHLWEATGQVINIAQSLLPPNITAVRYVMTDGFRWKFAILDTVNCVYYVDPGHLTLSLDDGSLHNWDDQVCKHKGLPLPHPIHAPCMEKMLASLKVILFVLTRWVINANNLDDDDKIFKLSGYPPAKETTNPDQPTPEPIAPAPAPGPIRPSRSKNGKK